MSALISNREKSHQTLPRAAWDVSEDVLRLTDLLAACPFAMLSAWPQLGSVQGYSGSAYLAKEKPATQSLLLPPSFPFSRDQLIQAGSILSQLPFHTLLHAKMYIQTTSLSIGYFLTASETKDYDSNDYGMQSNFNSRYKFLMPLSVSVFNQRLIIPLRKPSQISSIKNTANFSPTASSITSPADSGHNIWPSCSSKGHLESWIVLSLSKPQCSLERWIEFVWKQWIIIINSPACFIYWKKATQMPPSLKELSTFTSATHLPLPQLFFCLRNPIATAWVCYRICFSLHQHSSSLSVWCRHDAP